MKINRFNRVECKAVSNILEIAYRNIKLAITKQQTHNHIFNNRSNRESERPRGATIIKIYVYRVFFD